MLPLLRALIWIVLAAGAWTSANAQNGFDRPGGDYSRFVVPSGDPAVCAARCDRAVCWAARSPAVAAAMSGLAFSDRSIRSFSGCDWNTDHHWPGMSSSLTTRCASPIASFVSPAS